MAKGLCPTIGTQTGAKANAHEWFVTCVSTWGPLPMYHPSLQRLAASSLRRSSFVQGPSRYSPAINVPRVPSSPWQPRRSPTPRSPTDRPREEPHPFAWDVVTQAAVARCHVTLTSWRGGRSCSPASSCHVPEVVDGIPAAGGSLGAFRPLRSLGMLVRATLGARRLSCCPLAKPSSFLFLM